MQHQEVGGRSDMEPHMQHQEIGRRSNMEQNGDPKEPKDDTKTSVYVTALDGVGSVNSLFTVAIFIGLSFSEAPRSLEQRSACDADISMVKNLIVFEVVSFSFFLFSSLVAQGLKLAINLLNSKDDKADTTLIDKMHLRWGLVFCAVGTVMGCVFLMLSMIHFIEIKLGKLSCGSKSTVSAVVTMVLLVAIAVSMLSGLVVYAFRHTPKVSLPTNLNS